MTAADMSSFTHKDVKCEMVLKCIDDTAVGFDCEVTVVKLLSHFKNTPTLPTLPAVFPEAVQGTC